MLHVTLWTLILAYFLWGIYVIAHVSTLKTIDRATWQYKACLFFQKWNTTGVPSLLTHWKSKVQDSCVLRKELLVLPLSYLFMIIISILGFMLWCIVFVPAKFFYDWVITPFLFGTSPSVGFTKEYLKFLTLANKKKLNYTSFMRGSPFLFVGIPAIIWFEIERTLSGDTGAVELTITRGLLISTVIIAIIIWIVTRPSLKTAWRDVMGKWCRKLPAIN